MSTTTTSTGALDLVRVRPDDAAAVAMLTDFTNAARLVDDPDSPPAVPSIVAGDLAYGWDLDPDETYLYFGDARRDEDGLPVAVFATNMPHRDNRHLVWASITVRPDQRRRGHGSALLAELLQRTLAAGRKTIWLGVAADDEGSQAFLERHGFRYANPDARRRQVLAEVDSAHVDRLFAEAEARAADYELQRLSPPYDDDLLADLVEVTAAINDAPMGELTFEDEVFDLQRLRDLETARSGRGDRGYRVVARHRETGEIGGHTVVSLHPDRPTFGGQGDTAVARNHRGHRLGLLLKIDMMRWLAEAEPQLEVIETWNQAGNDFMISVNESLGYRLNRIFQLWERNLR